MRWLLIGLVVLVGCVADTRPDGGPVCTGVTCESQNRLVAEDREMYGGGCREFWTCDCGRVCAVTEGEDGSLAVDYRDALTSEPCNCRP